MAGGDVSRPTHRSLTWYWDINLLTWVVGTQPGGGSVVVTKSPQTASAATSVSVGASSTLLLAANSARTGVIVVLLSSTHIASLALDGGAAVLNKGITLTQYGSVFQMDPFCFTTGDIYAIASGSGTVLSVQEYA